MDSPAGQWLSRHPHILQKYYITCKDPHRNQGGFGLSSAEFCFVYYLSKALKGLDKNLTTHQEVKKLWSSYRGLNFKGGIVPSGADVVSQWLGKGVCLFSYKPWALESIAWAFKDLDFVLVRTNIVLNTWEYLKKDFNLPKSLLELADRAKKSVRDANTKEFIDIVKVYSSCLKSLKLVHQNTLDILDKLKKCPVIMGAKGCGAEGAEVVAVFFHPQNKKQVLAFLNTQLKHLKVVADSSCII